MIRAIYAALLVMAAVGSANAQSLTRCELSADRFTSELIGSMEVRRGGGGITVVCPSRNISLAADSGEMFGDDRVELYGRVHYDEPTRIDLRSDFLTYTLADERIHVRGHVIAQLPNGSTLTGPEAVWLRAVPRVRRIEELTATGNPTVTLGTKDSSEKPVVVNAASIFMTGDSLVYASRNVVITRTDLVARADSAFLDGRVGNESMRLMFKPSIEGLEGRKFKLEGRIIDAISRERKLERVIARDSGHATSQDLEIFAETIDLRMSNDAMERAIAFSRAGQARAIAPGQTITADSIDVRMPGQKVRVVYAVRNARADSDADTVRFHTTERDWLRGETVVAWFDSTATKDTSKTPPIERIIATHKADSAQAYYHMAAADTSIKRPAISYVRGREILIEFNNRRVGLVSVRDSVVGMYLEPKRDTASAAKPSATSKPPRPSGQPVIEESSHRAIGLPDNRAVRFRP
jgi:hypothetical protein